MKNIAMVEWHYRGGKEKVHKGFHKESCANVAVSL